MMVRLPKIALSPASRELPQRGSLIFSRQNCRRTANPAFCEKRSFSPSKVLEGSGGLLRKKSPSGVRGGAPRFPPPRPSPILAVEGAELDGLGDMLGLDTVALVQIGHGTGDTEDTVIAPSGESHFIKGVL